MNSFNILTIGVIVTFLGIFLMGITLNIYFTIISLIGLIIMFLAIIKSRHEDN